MNVDVYYTDEELRAQDETASRNAYSGPLHQPWDPDCIWTGPGVDSEARCPICRPIANPRNLPRFA